MDGLDPPNFRYFVAGVGNFPQITTLPNDITAGMHTVVVGGGGGGGGGIGCGGMKATIDITTTNATHGTLSSFTAVDPQPRRQRPTYLVGHLF